MGIDAFAQTAAPSTPAGPVNPAIPMLLQVLQFLPIIAIFYLLLIRPQQQQKKKLDQMLKELKKGDRVVTSGGIIGKVAKVDDQELQVEIAEGVRIKIVRSTVSEVRGKGEGTPPAKAKATSE